MPAGRPTDYKPEYAEQARKLCELGATDRDVAHFFDVDERTINRWKHVHPEFCQSLTVGKEAADARVEQSLYRKATGYSFDAEKIFHSDGVITRADYIEHVPPSDTAAIFWLKNRKPAEWRDKVDLEHGITSDLAAVLARIDGESRAIKPVFEIVG